MNTDGRAGPSGLARLVDEPQLFATQVWGRHAHLHHSPDSSAEQPAGFSDLLDLSGVDELLSTRGLRTPFLRVAKSGSTVPERFFTEGGGVGAAVGDQVSDARLARLFAEGATIVLQGLHRTWGPIVDFAAQLAEDLGHPVQANAYITPPQSQGFSAHYDVHDVFVLQLEGEKRWIIHEPVHRWPMRDEPWDVGGRKQRVAQAATQEPALDVVLRPGDCLYLPRGYLHAAKALEGVSAHLTLGVHVWTHDHLGKALTELALTRADDLRQPLALGVDVGDDAELVDSIAAVRASVHAAIDAVTDEEIADLLDRRADDTGRAAPILPLVQAAASRTPAPDAPVVLRRHLRLRRRPGDGGVRLHGRGVDVTIPVGSEVVARVLERVLDGNPYTPVALMQDSGADETQVMAIVRALLAAGVLVPAHT